MTFRLDTELSRAQAVQRSDLPVPCAPQPHTAEQTASSSKRVLKRFYRANAT